MPNPDRPNVLDHLSSLRRYALSLTRHESEAEDLVHDALVRAYEQRASYRQSGSLSGWLMSILHNTFIDGLRSRRAADRRDAQVSVVSERLMPAPQEDSLRVSQIRNAFNRLPDEQRASIHLVAIEGLTYAEAANVLGIPIEP